MADDDSQLQVIGTIPNALFANLNLPKALRNPAVPWSAELARIAALPRRTISFDQVAARRVTNLFSRYPEGTPDRLELWPVQATALIELVDAKGLVVVVAVGGGKTLVCYLAPAMVGSVRPLHLIPAALREKTRREFYEYSNSFYGPHPENYRIESYERLATAAQCDALTTYKPDLIVCDEAQRLKNPRAAATRRIRRYLDENPTCRFVALSGSFTKRSIKDFAHVAGWALKELSPVPRNWTELEPWAQAIDEKPAQNRRVLPGALKALCTEPAQEMAMRSSMVEERVRVARQVFRRRFEETKGVITSERAVPPVGLVVRELDSERFPFDPNDGMGDHWTRFRDSWELPSGEPLVDPLELSRHARELALGFFYHWTTPAPDPWLEARRAWAGFVRATLKHSRSIDTELQVANGVRNRTLAHWKDGASVLQVWETIKPTFVPVTEPYWLSNTAIIHCRQWMLENAGIVWVEQGAFGQRLSQASGVPYYGEQGRSPEGAVIEEHPKGRPLIASMRANGTGRNLQGWSSNLLTAIPFTGAQAEQLIGRTHRHGQKSECVTFDAIINCREHVKTFWRVVNDAEFIQASTGLAQRLGAASIDVPDMADIEDRPGSRWG